MEFRLEAVGQGTKLTVKENGFENIPLSRQSEAFRMNEEGWEEQMQNIQKYCEN